jgi:DNA-binding transcriptional MerR regulator
VKLSDAREVYALRFGPKEVAHLLCLPAGTVRSWSRRGLVDADPGLTGHHRHFYAIDVLYLAILKDLLSHGSTGRTATEIAAAVIYGERDAPVDAADPSVLRDRVRACQHDYTVTRPEVRYRDARRPYWLIFAGIRDLDATIARWSRIRSYAARHPRFCCLNLTRRLAEIEAGLAALSASRARGAANEKKLRQRRPSGR